MKYNYKWHRKFNHRDTTYVMTQQEAKAFSSKPNYPKIPIKKLPMRTRNKYNYCYSIDKTVTTIHYTIITFLCLMYSILLLTGINAIIYFLLWLFI